MSLRRATAVAYAVLIVAAATLVTVAAATRYSSMWAFYRLMRGRPYVHLSPATGPSLHDNVAGAVSDSVPALAVMLAALLLARAGRRYLALATAGLQLLGYHASMPDLPLLVTLRPDADPTTAVWLTRLGWTLGTCVAPLVLLVLARRRLPRPAVHSVRVVARLCPVLAIAAGGAWLATASDDHLTATVGVVLAIVLAGLLATGGYDRPWLAVAAPWVFLGVVALTEGRPWGPADLSWLPGGLLPAAGALALGALAARGVLLRAWARAFRRGPALTAA